MVAEVERKSYPQDVTDEEWAFVLPCLLLSREDRRSRKHSLRELFNGVRYLVRTGNQWRYMPHDLPPWPAVYQPMRRWMEAGVFEILVADVQQLSRHFGGRRGIVSSDSFATYSQAMVGTPPVCTDAFLRTYL